MSRPAGFGTRGAGVRPAPIRVVMAPPPWSRSSQRPLPVGRLHPAQRGGESDAGPEPSVAHDRDFGPFGPQSPVTGPGYDREDAYAVGNSWEGCHDLG